MRDNAYQVSRDELYGKVRQVIRQPVIVGHCTYQDGPFTPTCAQYYVTNSITCSGGGPYNTNVDAYCVYDASGFCSGVEGFKRASASNSASPPNIRYYWSPTNEPAFFSLRKK